MIFFSVSIQGAGLITLSVKDGDVRDVLQMMGEQSGLNIIPDISISGQVTLVLTDVTVEQALQTLLKVYNYHYEMVNDRTYIVSEQPLTEPYLIEIVDGSLTLIAQAIDINRILNDIGTKGQLNLIYDQSVNGQINANLINVDLLHGLKSLCSANSLIIVEKDGIFTVTSGMAAQSGRQIAVSYSKGLVSIDVKNGDMADLIRMIAEQSGINIILYGGTHQLVDLKINEVPVDDAIKMILAGTRYAFRKIDDVYLIGDKSINSPSSNLLTTNEVIHLKYLQAEKVPAMLPNIFPATNIKVIKELNALAVIGTKEEIDDLKEYLDKIDNKIPQIVVEAIILEVSRNNNRNPLYKLGIDANKDEGGSVLFDTIMGKLTYNSILKLKPDFYIHLEDMISEGIATVKARPKITTLNGIQAKINVGSVQYYKITKYPDGSDKDPETQYQSINAGITLDVTPWVSNTGEITLELHPNISNLGGASTEGPPQVSQRQVDTTVRVQSGETIILGGLIQDVKNETVSKVPFLGDLPLIGKLFQKTGYNQNQNELIIFITPHILDENVETISPEKMQQTINEMEKRYEKNIGVE